MRVDLRYVRNDIKEIRQDFKDFKQFYVTKEELINAVNTLDTRISGVVKDMGKTQERNQFYIRATFGAFIAAVIGVIVEAIRIAGHQ